MAAPAMILACLLAHSGVAVGSVQPTATWQCRWGRMVGVKHVSLHWGLNPGPSACKPDALPLRYRGICRKYLRPQQFPNTLPTPKKSQVAAQRPRYRKQAAPSSISSSAFAAPLSSACWGLPWVLLGRERFREIVGARMVGQLPGMRGRRRKYEAGPVCPNS